MKLKELILSNLKFSNKELSNGQIINVRYLDEPFEFQIPKAIIHFVENETIILDVDNKLFLEKMTSFETFISKRFNKELISPIENNLVKLKLPFKFSKPQFKVYHGSRLFNYFNLKAGDEIICLVFLDKLWNSESIHYCLNIKEIMLLKQ